MLKRTSYISLLLFIITYSLAIVGCDNTEEHEEVQDEHICEHLVETTSITIAAVADAQTAVDSLLSDANYRIQYQDHIRFDLNLMQDSTLLHYGYVPFKALDGDGDYYLYLDKEAHVELLNFTESTTVAPEDEMDHSDYCGDIHYKGLFELHAEDTYVLSFYETIDPMVGLLFVKAEDHEDHEDHDH